MDSKLKKTESVCGNCGNAGAHFYYKSAGITKFKRFNRVGNNYLADHRVFVFQPPHRLIRDDGQFIEPDYVAVFGDVFSYWADAGNQTEVSFCSRACAIAFSKLKNALLFRVTDGVVILPQQTHLDEYAQKHGLDHCLGAMESNSWEQPDEELRALLKARLQFPKRLFTLGMVVVDKGMNSLAEAAAQKLQDDYPLEMVVDYCFLLYFRIGKLDRADILYRKVLQENATLEALGSVRLSNWALAITGSDFTRARTLSWKAVELCPTSVEIIENHLSVLCAKAPDEAMDFLARHTADLATDVGFYSAGLTCLSSGQYAMAEEYLRAAASCKSDPLTSRYLAETLFCLGRYGNALNEVRDGVMSLEGYTVQGLPDLDGVQRFGYRLPYDQKRYLRKAFLALEGKLLCELGEQEAGRQRIKDSMDITLGFLSEEPLFNDLDQYVAGYPSRDRMASELAQAHLHIASVTREMNRQTVRVESLSSLIDAIAEVKSQWGKTALTFKEQILQDSAAEDFAARIHSFSLFLRQTNEERYTGARRTLRVRYQHLPEKVIEQLTNAEFLLSELAAFDAVPVCAGVVIELCKAVETGLNRLLVEAYVKWANASKKHPLVVTLMARDGREFPLEVTRAGATRNLMLGDLACLCRSDDPKWLDFLQVRCASAADWIRSELPDIILIVKDKFRNGCAHYSSADYGRAAQLDDLLSSHRVFERLDSLACEFSQSSRGDITGRSY
jgi:tetratricopeptide (TPR) repeat protein